MKNIEKKLDNILNNPNNISSEELEKEILNTLKDIRYNKIDNNILNKLLNHLTNADYNDYEGENKIKYTEKWFKNYPYETFMDFFSRELSDEKVLEIKSKITDCKMIIPNQSNIRAIDNMSNSNRLFQLKKDLKKPILESLKEVGITGVENYHYIDMNLWVSYYHRIHAAVKGIITDMIPVNGDDNFFGDNSLWILKIETEKSPVYHLIVGESLIQDFCFLKKIGDKIDIFDTIGYFNWGSQTVLLYNPEDYKNIQVKENSHVFAGDVVFK